MYNEVVTLIGTAAKEANSVGDVVEEPGEKNVFAEVHSVGSKRKLEALSVGLKLEWKFILADYYDYSGQERVRYEGVEYNVVDTYRAQDGSVELTVSRC